MNLFLIAFLLLVVLSSTSFAKKKNGETFIVWDKLNSLVDQEDNVEDESQPMTRIESLGLSKYPHYDWNS